MLSTASLGTVRVPKELLQVKGAALEEYVRNRLMQFIRCFALRLAQLVPQVSPGVLESIVRETFDTLPSPDYGQVPVDQLELQLVFRHDCMALGCTEPQCVLCQHNSQRRCSVNFNKKYLVGDKLLAKCGAAIRVELLDRATGKLYDGSLNGVQLELFTLDGAAYDSRFLCDAGRAQLSAAGPDVINAELDIRALLMNNKQQPLLAAHAGGQQDELGRLITKIDGGCLVLPDLYLTDSSEALLSGRKPPFRLVVRAKHADGRRLAIKHAVSEPFVVATRRVRASHKVEIPAMDDPVSKLEHMGRETVKKLADLRAAAQAQGVNLSGLEPEYCRVEKVGDFHQLVYRVDVDGQLRGQLQALLKLPKEKWDEAAEHARRAVVPDSRMRAWLSQAAGGGPGLGLLFGCRMGAADIKRPLALLQVVLSPSGVQQVEVIPQSSQTPGQRDVVRQLLPQAEASWWTQGHAGWTLLTLDTQDFQAKPLTPVMLDLSVFNQGAKSQHVLLPHTAALTMQTLQPQPQAAAMGTVPASDATDATALQQLLNVQQAAAAAAAAAAVGGPDPAAAAATAYQGWLPASVPTPLLDSPFTAAASVAAAAAATGCGQPTTSSNSGGRAISAQQQEQQPAAAAAAVPAASRPITPFQQPQQQQQSFVQGLPSVVDLHAMMSSGDLTEDVVAAIAAAYEANQCPPEVMDMLHQQMMLEQSDPDPLAAAAAEGAKTLDKSQQQQQQQQGLVSRLSGHAGAGGHSMVGCKRTFSAAAAAAAASGSGSGSRDHSDVTDHLRHDSDSSKSGSIRETLGITSAAAGEAAAAVPAAVAGNSAAAATGRAAAVSHGDHSKASARERSLDLVALRNMWPSMQLDALMALARPAAAAAAAAAAPPASASTESGKDTSHSTPAHVQSLLGPAPPLDLEPTLTNNMSLGTASSLLSIFDSIQPANSLQPLLPPSSGASDMYLELAPSLLAAAGLCSSQGSGPSTNSLNPNSVNSNSGNPNTLNPNIFQGLETWLGYMRSRQGGNGLTGLNSLGLEALPSLLLQGADSLSLTDAVTTGKDTDRTTTAAVAAAAAQQLDLAEKANARDPSTAAAAAAAAAAEGFASKRMKVSGIEFHSPGTDQACQGLGVSAVRKDTSLDQVHGRTELLAEIALGDLQQQQQQQGEPMEL